MILHTIVSDTIVSSTGAPQSDLPSSSQILWTLHFSICSQSCHLQRFLNNRHHVLCQQRPGRWNTWVWWTGFSGGEHLQFNITKTKELVLDFRRLPKKDQSCLYFLRGHWSFKSIKCCVLISCTTFLFIIMCNGTYLLCHALIQCAIRSRSCATLLFIIIIIIIM